MSGPAELRKRPRVLILYLGWVANTARVLRQIDFLSADYEIVLAAFDPPAELSNIEVLELPPRPPGGGDAVRRAARIALRLTGRYEAAYWRDRHVQKWRSILKTVLPVDLVLANDLFALPVARDLGAPVIFDAHEHWTSESASWTRGQRLRMRGAHEWLVDRHAAAAAATMTVSRGIVRDYAERIGQTPALVTNAPFHQAIEPSPVGDPLRLVHVGFADPRRRLEDTIEAVGSLDEHFTLDLFLARDSDYRRSLERLAQRYDRIRVLPGIPNRDLITTCNAYDVGVFLLPDNFPNQIHVLPNKLFDYIQARLAVAVGPSPEMAEIVRGWECGVVSDDFSPQSFAMALSRLTRDDVTAMKQNAGRAAAVLSADHNRDIVLAVARDALAQNEAGRGATRSHGITTLPT